ncbi:MAG: FecR family protein, partial [Acidiferrobacterales bacterium]
MMRHLQIILILISLPLSAIVRADSPAMVEGLQLPAWLERNGIRDSLTLGMSLQPQDTVETGPGARLLIQLKDGSLVKLGENASLTLAELEPAASSRGIFSSLLNVVRGAFRLTSAKLTRQRKSNLEINIASLTLGVRGTDVWGKAAGDRDIVCLIEGHI